VRRVLRLLAACAAGPVATTAAGPVPLRAQVVAGPRAASIQVAPGGQVTVPIVADMTGGGGVSLGSLTARLAWRPGTLRFDGAAPGTFGVPVVNVDSAAGVLRLAAASAAGATGEVVVLQATFTGIGPAGDTTTLGFTVDEMAAAGTFADIARVATGALVCVGSAAGRWGDLDGNDTLSSFDALLIVTYAVGLSIAPYTAGAGDVDGDGDTDTRDALVVLSYVVGLPTPGFRPGQAIGGACGGNPPATVSAAPTGLTLVVGDTVPATAVARDTAGQIVSVPGLQWTTLDQSVATVTPAGRVAAVGAGVTGAVAVVAPGVMDTVGVTVVTTRTVWTVDVTAAAGSPAQIGSPAYPFETLQQAVDRAAAGDTILVRGGGYGSGAVSDKPLTIAGQAGFPRPRFRGPIGFAGIGAATVRLSRLVVADAAEGVRVQGTGGGVVLLDSVTVERAGGPGIDVVNVDSLALVDVTVAGARDKGIRADSVRSAAFLRVSVDGVTAANGEGTGRTLLLTRAQAFAADQSSFRLGDVALDSVGDIRLRQVQVAESFTGLFSAVGATSVVLDTVLFRLGGDAAFTGFAVSLDLVPGGTVTGNEVEIREVTGQGLMVSRAAVADFTGLRVYTSGRSDADAAGAFPDVERLLVRRGAFRNGRVFHAGGLFSTARVLALDSVDFQQAWLSASLLDTVRIRVAWLNGALGAGAPLLGVDTVRVVSLVGVEARNASPSYAAVQVSRGDSLRADSLYVHGNPSRGMYVYSVRTASMVGNRFEGNAGQEPWYGNVVLYVPVVRVAHSVFEEVANTRSLSWYGYQNTTQALTVDTTAFRGSEVGVSVYASYPATVTVRGASLAPGPVSIGRQLLYVSAPGRVRVLDSRADTTEYGYAAIGGYTDTLDVLNAQLRYVGTGVNISSYSGGTAPVTVASSTILCRPGGYGSYYGIAVANRDVALTGNSISGCWTGVYLYSNSARAATIRGNTITDVDSVNGTHGISVVGSWTRPVVAQNTVARGRMPGGAISLEAYPGSIDSARVDSNTVQDGVGRGIYQYGDARATSIRGNVVERMRPHYGFNEGAIMVESGTTADTVRVRGNTVRQNRAPGILLATLSPIRLDSNVVVDDSVFGVRVESNPTPVVGRHNFLARNGDGIYVNGPLTIDSSVIQQSSRAGARYGGTGTVTLAANYWGDPSGPRCDTGCAGALGDSLVGSASLNYVPFLTAPPSTPTGAPPALRSAAAPAAPAPAPAPRAVTAAWFEGQRRALRVRVEVDR
jgi:hypothetical protein